MPPKSESRRARVESQDGKYAAVGKIIGNEQTPQTAEESYRFRPVSSKTLFTTDYKLEWLVQRLLVRNQPAVVGGPKKSLKTTTLIDLAVSLATATPFFGRFEVYKNHRVVIISGESGEPVLQEAGRRVCVARGVDPELLDLWWDFKLPQLANPLDRQELSRGLKSLEASVVIIDPLYLCLLAGMDARDVEAGNLYKMGPLLSQVCRCCLDAGCTPILCHHARKGFDKIEDPLDLDDLSFAGIAEFARQWILQNPRKPFDPNTGSSKLWVSVGGSAGQSGCWAVDVEEGVIRDDFAGRKWEVTVKTVSDTRADDQAQKDSKRADERNRLDREADDKFLEALDRLDEDRHGVSLRSVREAAGLSSTKANSAFYRLKLSGIVEELPIEVTIGNGAKRKAQGVRHANS